MVDNIRKTHQASCITEGYALYTSAIMASKNAILRSVADWDFLARFIYQIRSLDKSIRCLVASQFVSMLEMTKNKFEPTSQALQS